MASKASASHKRTASSAPETSDPPAAKISKSTEKTATTKASKSTNETPKDAPPDAPNPATLSLTYHTGDIFAAPDHSLLIHACNTQGSWGAGIAAAFRAKYPQAYKRYRAHCMNMHNPTTNPVPTGTCLLIPPCETDPSIPKHWIGCLFTSAKYGKAKDKPTAILKNTRPAMKELLQQVNEASDGEDRVKEVRMCKINSARFGVPWERTVEVLEEIEVEEGWVGAVEVWSID